MGVSMAQGTLEVLVGGISEAAQGKVLATPLREWRTMQDRRNFPACPPDATHTALVDEVCSEWLTRAVVGNLRGNFEEFKGR